MTPEEYINKQKKWRDGLIRLRKIISKSALREEVKWGLPVYTTDGKNIVGIGAFKNFFAVWFFQGALLKDPTRVLVNAQEGKTKAMRQWRFTSADQIPEMTLLQYISEAIYNQRAGKEIKPDSKKPLILPSELKDAFGIGPALKEAFYALTPGKRREFADYIAEAKKDSTRARRLKKIVPMILEGRGLNDQHRSKPN